MCYNMFFFSKPLFSDFNMFYVYLALVVLNKTNTMQILLQKEFIKIEMVLHTSKRLTALTNTVLK